MKSADTLSTTYLLDVNMLVALTWRDHVLHRPAQHWFAGREEATWATTTVTESGFVRVSMNSGISENAVSWCSALEMLRTIRATPGHRWWPDDVGLASSPLVQRAPVVSHRQVTDVHLVALAARHNGRLVTLDRGIVQALHPEDRALVKVVPVS